MVNKMSKERELLQTVAVQLLVFDLKQSSDLVDEIQELLAQPEQTEQFPLPGERLIEMWRDGYDAGVRLAQPEPVYWENEKKALLNEIDHLTNRLAQPELSTDSLQLDEQDLREDLREGLREDLREDPVAWMWTRNYEGGGYTNMVFQMRCEADEYAKDSESLKRPDLVRPLYLGETR